MATGLQPTCQPHVVSTRVSDVRKPSTTPGTMVPRRHVSSIIHQRLHQTTTPVGLASSTWEFPSQTSSKCHGSTKLPSRDQTHPQLDRIILTPESSPSYGESFNTDSETPLCQSRMGGSSYIVTNDGDPVSRNHSDRGTPQSLTRECLPSQQPLLMDLTEDESDGYGVEDYMTEDQFNGWITQQTEEEVRRTSARQRHSKSKEQRESSVRPLRNPPIAAPLAELDSFHYIGMRLGGKVCVELKDGDFMRIVHVLQDTANSDVMVRGWIFRRTKEMNGVLPKKLNEVCWILAIDEDDSRDHKVQAMETVPVESIVKRRALRLTNQEFPALSFRDQLEPEDVVARDRVLVCRYSYTSFYPTAKAREHNKWCEKALLRLRAADSDLSCGIKDDVIRQAWRGDTIKGGANTGMLPGEKEFLDRESHDSQGLQRGDSTHRLSLPGRKCSVASLVIDLEEMRTSDPTLKCEPKKPSYSPAPTVQAQGRRRSGESGSKGLTKKYTIHPSERSSEVQYVDLEEDDFGVARDFVALGQNLFTNHRQHFEERTQQSDRIPSPDVVEIKAKFETFSRLGTLRREYTGQVKSTFNPLQRQARKRTTDEHPLASSVSKRMALPLGISREAQGSTSSPLARHFKRPLSPTDSDKGFGRSAFIDLVEDNIALRSSRTSQTPRNLLPPRGSQLPQTLRSQPQAHLTISSAKSTQRYTVGDSFCGAGGMSRGCIMAGLRIAWAFDFNAHACDSYELNFYATRLYRIWAHEFSGLKEDHKVDILHLSPPCQFFSDAHTVEGKDDDMNIASLFAIYELLVKAKPRVVTLEQTSGLLRRHPVFMNSVIQMFTARGFSIRWRVLNCADFGLPQRRLRVFIIASW